MSMFAGSLVAMGAPGQGGGTVTDAIFLFAVLVGVVYFIVLRPTQQQRKKIDTFLAALKVGDRVITTGGIYGSIVKLGDTSVQLQVANNVRIEVARAAIGGYQGQSPVVESTNP
jgi:preprotein translocase subunit YajC